MEWLNVPAKWSEEPNLLRVTAQGGTDFWRTTNYGYVRDTGHLYGDVISGEFEFPSGSVVLTLPSTTRRAPW